MLLFVGSSKHKINSIHNRAPCQMATQMENKESDGNKWKKDQDHAQWCHIFQSLTETSRLEKCLPNKKDKAICNDCRSC